MIPLRLPIKSLKNFEDINEELSSKLEVLEEVAGQVIEHLDYMREYQYLDFLGFAINYDMIYEIFSFNMLIFYMIYS